MKIIKHKEFKERMSQCLATLRAMQYLPETKPDVEKSMFMVKNTKWIDKSFIVVEPETMAVILTEAGLENEATAILEAKQGIRKEISTRMKVLRSKGSHKDE